MSLGIPLPGSAGDSLLQGLQVGGQLGSNMLQNLLQRHQMGSQAEQFGYAQELADKQFQQQQAIRDQLLPYQIQQYQLAQEMNPYEQMLKSAQAQKAMQEANAYSMLLGGQPLTESAPSFGGVGESIGDPTTLDPDQMTAGELAVQGILAPPSGKPPSMEQVQQGFSGGPPVLDPNQMTPGELAVAKKLGFDFGQEMPDVKRQRELEQFKEKERFKQEAPKEIPTTQSMTENQRVVTSVNNIIPMINKLKNMGHPRKINISPDQRAAYVGTVNSIADNLMSAYNLPRTKESLNMVLSMVERGALESDQSYKKRLGEVSKELEDRKKSAFQVLKSGRVEASTPERVRKRFNPVTGGFD